MKRSPVGAKYIRQRRGKAAVRVVRCPCGDPESFVEGPKDAAAWLRAVGPVSCNVCGRTLLVDVEADRVEFVGESEAIP